MPQKFFACDILSSEVTFQSPFKLKIFLCKFFFIPSICGCHQLYDFEVIRGIISMLGSFKIIQNKGVNKGTVQPYIFCHYMPAL